jgi:serine O-acetyltransferase
MFARFREDIRAIKERDPAARSAWEVMTLYPGFHAIQTQRVAHWFWVRGFRWIGRAISQFSRWMTGIEIHPGATIGRRVFIDHGMGVVIGETAEVGDDCTIYQGVTLGGTSLERKKRHPTLEPRVVVGAGAKVLGPFTVGADAKIGSNSVVLKPVPPGASAVGIPARIVAAAITSGLEEKAARVGFTAYAISSDLDDPMVQALHKLLDHTIANEDRLDKLVARLCDQGTVDCNDLREVESPPLDPRMANRLLG